MNPVLRFTMPSEHTRKYQLPFRWPKSPINIVLVEPKIPQNTGNIARLCAGTGSRLHLVKPLGFRITDKDLKRAGLDYWDHVEVDTHENYCAFREQNPTPRTFLFSTAGQRNLYDVRFKAGDALVFGSETEGLSDELLEEADPEQVVQIPIVTDYVRSLNLASSVSIVLYEALRQIDANNLD